MKTKKLLGAAACFAAMILASCGDGTTGNGNNDSLFSRIPSIYETEFPASMRKSRWKSLKR